MRYYGLAEYRADIVAAHGRYEEVIRANCQSNGCVIPLSEKAAYQAKGMASGCKNQMLGAATKRLKAAVALELLDQLKEYDLTVTLAVKITKQLLGRAISRKVLLDLYGTTNRTAADKSRGFDSLEEIYQGEVFLAAQAKLESRLAQAEIIRSLVKEEQSQGSGAAKKLLSASLELGEKYPSRGFV